MACRARFRHPRRDGPHQPRAYRASKGTCRTLRSPDATTGQSRCGAGGEGERASGKDGVRTMNSGWQQKRLGGVATLQRGFDLPHRLRKPGSVPIVTSSGFEDTHCEAKVRAPGIVTGRYGTIGKVFFVNQDFWPLNTTLYVRDFHGNDPLFLSYLLRTIDFQTHSGKSG